jgi:hypothetical protein
MWINYTSLVAPAHKLHSSNPAAARILGPFNI